ncbi:MAG TPA: L-histidine N(alpha)-methyltransferase [Verrucomicrobiae bacterium]|nr:L-histidine N(alpha)-methyltransferase [Verrucomicrobiae bacterium]
MNIGPVGTLDFAIHKSQWPCNRRAALTACLRGRSIEARFHYESPAQTAAWLALHESHSPARTDPAVARLYPDSITSCLHDGEPITCLASIGCGGGQKDVDTLRASHATAYAAIDASSGMVAEALNRVCGAMPAIAARGLVADLSNTAGIAAWVRDAFPHHGSILWLAFGIVPNIPAPNIPSLLRAFLQRPGVRALVGTNLIPGRDPRSEMAAILPQYDNSPTRRWLAILPQSLGIPTSPDDIRFTVLPPAEGHPWRIQACLVIRQACRVDLFGERITFPKDESLRLFFSNRFTPEGVASLARAAGLHIARASIAPSGEEGVFELHPPR